MPRRADRPGRLPGRSRKDDVQAPQGGSRLPRAQARRGEERGREPNAARPPWRRRRWRRRRRRSLFADVADAADVAAEASVSAPIVVESERADTGLVCSHTKKKKKKKKEKTSSGSDSDSSSGSDSDSQVETGDAVSKSSVVETRIEDNSKMVSLQLSAYESSTRPRRRSLVLAAKLKDASDEDRLQAAKAKCAARRYGIRGNGNCARADSAHLPTRRRSREGPAPVAACLSPLLITSLPMGTSSPVGIDSPLSFPRSRIEGNSTLLSSASPCVLLVRDRRLPDRLDRTGRRGETHFVGAITTDLKATLKYAADVYDMARGAETSPPSSKTKGPCAGPYIRSSVHARTHAFGRARMCVRSYLPATSLKIRELLIPRPSPSRKKKRTRARSPPHV